MYDRATYSGAVSIMIILMSHLTGLCPGPDLSVMSRICCFVTSSGSCSYVGTGLSVLFVIVEFFNMELFREIRRTSGASANVLRIVNSLQRG